MKTLLRQFLIGATVLAAVTSDYAAARPCPMSKVPDQDNLLAGGLGGLVVSTTSDIAQTFTVGMDGRLTRVELRLKQHEGEPTEDLVFDLVTTDGTGIPTTTQLAHVVLPPSEIPSTFGIVTVDLSSFVVSVSVDDVLAIVLSSNVLGSAARYGWDGDLGGSYPRGTAFTFGTENPRDMAFRTFVCQDEIPTVSTWGLIVMALLLLIGGKVYFSRRRATQA